MNYQQIKQLISQKPKSIWNSNTSNTKAVFENYTITIEHLQTGGYYSHVYSHDIKEFQGFGITRKRAQQAAPDHLIERFKEKIRYFESFGDNLFINHQLENRKLALHELYQQKELLSEL